jgi:hypothetical protein
MTQPVGDRPGLADGELTLDRQSADGYRSREEALNAAQDHLRALAAAQSEQLCADGEACDPRTSRCKAVVLDQDLPAVVGTFAHLDDDGDPSFGWLIEGTVPVRCLCVGKRRQNKPGPRQAAAQPAATAAAPRRRSRKPAGQAADRKSAR